MMDTLHDENNILYQLPFHLYGNYKSGNLRQWMVALATLDLFQSTAIVVH